MLHPREFWLDALKKFYRGRHLIVEVPAHGERIDEGHNVSAILTGIHLHIKLPIREVELGNPKLEVLCSFIKCRRCGRKT